MHKYRLSRITLVLLCAWPALASAQVGLQVKPGPSLKLNPPGIQPDGPLYLEADRVRGHTERETEAEGDVRLRRDGRAVFADWLHYDQQKEQVTAIGNVRLEQDTDLVEGDRLDYNLATDRGSMDKPRYTLRRDVPGAPASGPVTDARGTAERILFEGPQVYNAQNAQYTTCGPGNDDWFVRARELRIDKGRDAGVARDASIVFLDHTIFYTPYLSFSLHQQRKSGFLTPHYGSSSTSGFEFTLPYYWNIAPNRDATFYPRFMTRRGPQLNTDLRYLEPTYRGETRFELLPDDQQLNRTRWGYFLKHSQTFADTWGASLNLNRVSDPKYFTDLSTVVALTSQSSLPSEGVLARGGTWGQGGTFVFSALAQRWQTLQTDPSAPIIAPYNRLPQLALTALNQDVLHTDFDFIGSYVGFSHPTLVNGKRVMGYPSFSLPLQSSYAYITPRVGMHLTRYFVDPNAANLTNQTRALPVFSADSGMVLERDIRLAGQFFTQTLEPRLFYVNIPYRDQTRLPNFESGVQDINFATIFAENQFSGQDRINDANQITVGVSSRLIHPESGIERLRAGVAQRYYFSSQRVTVPGIPPRPDQSSSSDLLAALSGTVAPSWTAEAGWQYNTDLNRTQKLNVATRFQPQQGKVLNLAYRSTVDLIRQTDISFQWPISSQWGAVGRWNWSLRDNRTLEALAGLEYDGGCWAFRVVAHRFATTTQAASTSIFLQLELNGVSRIGSNPLDILRRNVGGYMRADPRSPRTDDYHVPDR